MQISPQITNFIKGASYTSIKTLNEVGAYTRELASMLAQGTDKFIASKTNKSVVQIAKKADISKDTLIGALVSSSAIILTFKAIKGIIKKINELIKK